MKIYYPSFKEFRKQFKKVFEANENSQSAQTTEKLEDMDTVVSPYNTEKTIDMKKLKKEIEKIKANIVTQSDLYRPYVHDMSPTIYTWAVQTMATDGVRLFINPEFADSLPWLGKIFVILHEIMHNILSHGQRLAGRDARLFNIAADYEVNALLIDTTDDFDEKLIKELNGLYEKKYLSVPVEEIYRDLMKNPPPQPPPKIDPRKPQGGGGTPPPGAQGQEGEAEIDIPVGTKVRIKATGKTGIVTAVNPDGTFEIDPLNEELVMPRLIKESYQRGDFIPIIQRQGGEGSGQKGGMTPKGDYEIEIENPKGGESGEDDGKKKPKTTVKGEQQGDEEKKKGKNKGSGQPKPGKGFSEEEYGIARRIQNVDQGNTGAIIDKRTGEEIARAAGYTDEEARVGDDDKSWEERAKGMLQRLKDYNPGEGRGKHLKATLERLYKAVNDWKSIFRLYVGKVLSPETEERVGEKKFLYKSDEYIKRGDFEKRDALKKAVIAVDVSGSMTSIKNVYEKLMAEMTGIIQSKRIKEVIILYFDSGVHENRIQVVRRGQKVKFQKFDGGGTSFQSVLDFVHTKYKDRINILVYLTDGGDYAERLKRPPYANKVIWVIYDNFDFNAPFGRIIKVASKDF